MSSTVLAEIVVPIVVAVALAVWITMVYRAEAARLRLIAPWQQAAP